MCQQCVTAGMCPKSILLVPQKVDNNEMRGKKAPPLEMKSILKNLRERMEMGPCGRAMSQNKLANVLRKGKAD